MGSIAKAITEASKATGYLMLRDNQKKTLEAYLSGRDVFVSVPTGAGKSLTFELAPYAFDCLNGDQANSALLLLRVSSAVSPLSLTCASLFTDIIPPFFLGFNGLPR